MESCRDESTNRREFPCQDDSSLRREQRRNSIQAQTKKIDEDEVPNLVAWFQDPWSEIRKDAAKAIKAYRHTLTPAAENRLLFLLVESLERVDVSWQVVHGSLLGITVVVNEGTDNVVSATIQSLCLKLVGHKLPPVREAAAACMLRLLSTNQLTIAQLVSQVLRCLSVCLCNDENATTTMDSTATTNNVSVQEMDELDGLLGCLQEALVHGSVSIESSLVTLSLTNLVDSVDSEMSTLNTRTASSSSRTLLHRVLDVVESCMGHPSSSVVRQHAGQIFLLIYNNLPSCSPSLAETHPRQDDLSTGTAEAVSRHTLTYTILLPTLTTLAEPHVHHHVRQQEKSSDNWQKQEVCLLVAEDVLQNTLQSHLRAMTSLQWRGFDLPASLVSLLSALRQGAAQALLHPQFEIRRMFGQILPLLARVTVVLQPAALMDFAGFGSLTSSSTSSSHGNGRLIVRCVWLTAVCKAAQHIAELALTSSTTPSTPSSSSSSAHPLLVLLQSSSLSPVSSLPTTDSSSCGPTGSSSSSTSIENTVRGFVWANEVTGRLSEEHAKSAFSSALKAIIEQESGQDDNNHGMNSNNRNKSDSNGGVHSTYVALFAEVSSSSSSSSSSWPTIAAFQALADSLIAVRSMAHMHVQSLWALCPPPSSSGSPLSSNMVPEDVISCDFVEAAAVVAAFLITVDGQRCLPLLWTQPSSSSSSSSSSFTSDSNSSRDGSTPPLPLPLFVMLLKAVQRVARDATLGNTTYPNSANQSGCSTRSPSISAKGTPNKNGSGSGATPTSSSGALFFPSSRTPSTPTISPGGPPSLAASNPALALALTLTPATSGGTTTASSGGGGGGERGGRFRSVSSAAALEIGLGVGSNRLCRIDVRGFLTDSSDDSGGGDGDSGINQTSMKRSSASPPPPPLPNTTTTPIKSPPLPPSSSSNGSPLTSLFLRVDTSSSPSSSSPPLRTSWPLLPSLTDPTTDLSGLGLGHDGSPDLSGLDSSAVTANRWMCEALAPLLPTLTLALTYDPSSSSSAGNSSGTRASAIMASVLADWTAHISVNSLWLDRRLMARKALFTALPRLLDQARGGAATGSIPPSIDLSDASFSHISLTLTSTSSRGHFHTPHHCLAETAVSALAALTAVLPGTPGLPGGPISTTLQSGGSSTTKARQPYYLEPLAIACLLRTLRGCVGTGRVMGSDSVVGQLRSALAMYREKYPCTMPGGGMGALSMLSIKALAEEMDETTAEPGDNSTSNKEKEEEEEFSDWDDEEEETVVRGPGMTVRRTSFTFCDDVVTMHGEMNLLFPQ